MAHFIPTMEKVGEEDPIDIHMKHVWKLHSLPLIHSTDQHGNFTLKYIQKMFKALGIEQRFSTAYHPQTQGQVENLNGWLETFLQMFCNHQKNNWADLLHMAEFAWNNHHHSSLKMTPFFTNYGMHPMMMDVPTTGQQDTPKRIERLLELRKEIREQLRTAQRRQETQYNKGRVLEPEFKPGDKVYLATNNLITDKGSKKLSDLRMGPFKIIKAVGPRAYKLKPLTHMKVNPTFNVALLTKHNEGLIPGRAPSEPTPVIVEGQEQYEIERILDSSWLGKHFQYKVTYKGYGKEHDEWQFRDDLLEDLGEKVLQELEEHFGTHFDFCFVIT